MITGPKTVEQLPKFLIVLGGGAIGSELAQVMARLGVQVTVVEGADRLLPRNEPEVGEVLAEVFEADGITVHTGQSASDLAYLGNLDENTEPLNLDALSAVTFTDPDPEAGAVGLRQARP